MPGLANFKAGVVACPVLAWVVLEIVYLTPFGNVRTAVIFVPFFTDGIVKLTLLLSEVF